MTDHAHIAETLRARRDYLNDKLRTYENALDRPPPPDFEDRATEREGDEVLESLGRSGLAELRQIEAALARIEDGSFGICAACGGDISPERIAAVPTAAKCRACA